MIIGHEVIGSGARNVIVLHGWFGDHRIWAPTFPFLNQQEFSYAFVDYRGYGMSRFQNGLYTMQEISADVIALADFLRWGTFCVVGHSMGGMAAQRVALDAGGRVAAIVAITPVPASGTAFPPEVQQLFEKVVWDNDAAREVINTSLGTQSSPGMIKYILRHQRETSMSVAFSAYLREFSKTDFADELKVAKLKTPILALYGEYDGGITEAMVRATFPSIWPHVVIEAIASGHYPMLKCPEELISRIQAYLLAQRR